MLAATYFYLVLQKMKKKRTQLKLSHEPLKPPFFDLDVICNFIGDTIIIMENKNVEKINRKPYFFLKRQLNISSLLYFFFFFAFVNLLSQAAGPLCATL